MGVLVNARVTIAAAVVVATLISVLNIVLLAQTSALDRRRGHPPGRPDRSSSGDERASTQIRRPLTDLPFAKYKRQDVRIGLRCPETGARGSRAGRRRAVDPHLEVQVGPEAVARAADVADHLALRHLLRRRRRRSRTGGRTRSRSRRRGRSPSGCRSRSSSRARSRCPTAAAWIGVPYPTPMSMPSCIRPQRHAERARDGPVDRPDQAVRGAASSRPARTARTRTATSLRRLDLRRELRARLPAAPRPR